jgi:hypothetical protein
LVLLMARIWLCAQRKLFWNVEKGMDRTFPDLRCLGFLPVMLHAINR